MLERFGSSSDLNQLLKEFDVLDLNPNRRVNISITTKYKHFSLKKISVY